MVLNLGWSTSSTATNREPECDGLPLTPLFVPHKAVRRLAKRTHYNRIDLNVFYFAISVMSCLGRAQLVRWQTSQGRRVRRSLLAANRLSQR
jgi:hypothetical protein